MRHLLFWHWGTSRAVLTSSYCCIKLLILKSLLYVACRRGDVLPPVLPKKSMCLGQRYVVIIAYTQVSYSRADLFHLDCPLGLSFFFWLQPAHLRPRVFFLLPIEVIAESLGFFWFLIVVLNCLVWRAYCMLDYHISSGLLPVLLKKYACLGQLRVLFGVY